MMMDDYLYKFYQKIGENSGGIEPEEVMADALFKLAGELSLNSLNENGQLKSNMQNYH